MFNTTTSAFKRNNNHQVLGQSTFGKFVVAKELNPYSFKMTEEMKFTENDIIRMNITLGITGDMFRSHGIFYTDFMQNEHDKKKRI